MRSAEPTISIAILESEAERAAVERVQEMLGSGTGVAQVAQTTGLTRQAVNRIKTNPAAVEKTLAEWFSS